MSKEIYDGSIDWEDHIFPSFQAFQHLECFVEFSVYDHFLVPVIWEGVRTLCAAYSVFHMVCGLLGLVQYVLGLVQTARVDEDQGKLHESIWYQVVIMFQLLLTVK